MREGLHATAHACKDINHLESKGDDTFKTRAPSALPACTQGCENKDCVQQHTRAMAASIFGATGEDTSSLTLADGTHLDLEQQGSMLLRLELAGLFAGVTKAVHSGDTQVCIV